MSTYDDSARPEDDESDDSALPTVDGLTDTAATTTGLPTRLTELLAQRPGGSAGDTARAITALEDAIRRESNDTLRGRLSAARALILDLPLAD
jgi:hypothetical protein